MNECAALVAHEQLTVALTVYGLVSECADTHTALTWL